MNERLGSVLSLEGSRLQGFDRRIAPFFVKRASAFTYFLDKLPACGFRRSGIERRGWIVLDLELYAACFAVASYHGTDQ
jgi:hypothetical protein